MKMKTKIILISLFSTLFLGCTPQTELQIIQPECPKFNTESFELQGNYTIKNLKLTKKDKYYIEIPRDDFVDFANEYQNLKEKYNILLNSINEFQKKGKE